LPKILWVIGTVNYPSALLNGYPVSVEITERAIRTVPRIKKTRCRAVR